MAREEGKSPTAGSHFSAVFTTANVMALIGLLTITWPYFVESVSLSGFQALSKQVGTVLLTSGLLGILYQYTIRRRFIKEVEDKLRATINERFESLEDHRIAGVERIYKELPVDVMKKRFQEATESVRILQTWMGNLQTIRGSLCVAASRDCKVQILLLHPDSEHVLHRNKDIGNKFEDSAKKAIESELDTLWELQSREEVKGNIEVKLYRVTPIMSIHGYDDTNIVGMYWRNLSSASGPQFEVAGQGEQESFFAYRVRDHFDNLWENESVSAEDYRGSVSF